ncbi:MAG: choice-of-anchor D domain-containing protein [Bacteroidota bacterium]
MKLILPIAAAMMIGACAHGLAQVGTWENINPPGHTGNYSGLAFPTRDTGYAVSTPGNFSDPRSTIMKTTDGGDNWSLASLEGVWASDLAFFNADHGLAPGQNLACGCASLETTTDGGATWTEKTFPDTKSFNSIQLLDATTGIIDGAGSTIYRTTDAGVTWKKIVIDAVNQAGLGRISFPTPTVGYMLAALKGRTVINVVYKTTDGGLTWKQIHDGGANSTTLYQDLEFVTPEIGFITGRADSKAIYKTVDGGVTWTRVYKPTLPETAVMAGIAFPSPRVGYACGSDGTIVTTTDGGATWRPENSGTNGTLSALAFTDEKTGFAGGLFGVLLKRLAPEAPTAMLDHSSLDFGTVPSKEMKELTATLSAANDAGLRIQNITLNQQNGAAFTLVEPAGGYPIDITPGQPLTLRFRFSPATAATYSATATIATNDEANGAIQISLHGEASGTVAPTALLDHSSLDFGTVPSNRTKELTATLSAANDAGLRIQNIALNQQDGAAFTLLEPAGGFPIDITPGQPLTLRFRFAPATAGTAYSATATIETNDEANGTLQMNLHGDGSGAVASVDDYAPSASPAINCLPNPVAGNAIVTIDLPRASGYLHAALFNTLGQPIVTLHDGPATAGTHSFTLNAETLPAGLYYCIVRAGDLTGVREITITR